MKRGQAEQKVLPEAIYHWGVERGIRVGINNQYFLS